MRYLKYILFLIILCPSYVNAAVCDNATKVRLQSLAQNITTSYDYIEENDNVTFNINFRNLSSELYITDITNGNKYYYNGSERSVTGFLPDTTYKFEVRSIDVLCSGKALYYIYVTTPAYNKYYKDPICNGVNHKYCNKWQKVTLSYEQFIEEIEKYKYIPEEEINNNENIKGIFDYITEFYLKTYYIILPLVIIICIIFIIVDRKKNSLF